MPAVLDMSPVGERVSMCRGRLDTGRSDPANSEERIEASTGGLVVARERIEDVGDAKIDDVE